MLQMSINNIIIRMRWELYIITSKMAAIAIKQTVMLDYKNIYDDTFIIFK